jgi:hypothetical protein
MNRKRKVYSQRVRFHQQKSASKVSTRVRAPMARTPVHFRRFDDGTLIETIRNADSGVLCLLVFKNGSIKMVDRYECGSQCFVPCAIPPTLAQTIRIASGVNSCAQLQQLVQEIAAILRRFIDLPTEEIFLISIFVLCTWIPERLPIAPYLWLVGPLGSGKTTLLTLLQSLSRRAILIGDLKPAALYQLPELLQPTLLLDESDMGDSGMSQEFQRLLRIGNRQGAVVIRNGRAHDCYCVKVLSSREPPSDAALASRSIFIGMSPTARQMPLLDPVTAEQIAADFQAKLLMFRLQNFDRFDASRPLFAAIENLTPRVRDLGRALGVPLLGNADLEKDLSEILHEQDRDARVHRALEPEWLVAEVLFGLCHPRPLTSGLFPTIVSAFVGSIAATVNEKMKERGEGVTLTAKKTGLVLRALGFRTQLLGSLGRGVVFTPAVRAAIHRLAQRLGINRRNLVPSLDDAPKYGGAPCALCEKFSLTGGLRLAEFAEPRPPRRSGHRRRLFELDAAG